MKSLGWQEGSILFGFAYIASWVLFAFGMAQADSNSVQFFGYFFNPKSLLYALVFLPHIFFMFVLGFGGLSAFSHKNILVRFRQRHQILIYGAGIFGGFSLALMVILPTWFKSVWESPWSTLDYYASLISHHFSHLLNIGQEPFESGFILIFWMVFGGLLGWLMSRPIPARMILSLSIFISLIARCWVLYALD